MLMLITTVIKMLWNVIFYGGNLNVINMLDTKINA